MSAERNSLLIVTRHAPYGASLARSALDTALAAAAFEQPVALLFQGEGVLQLLPAQDSEGLGTRNHRRVLDSLPLYGLETLYVDAGALAAFGLDPGELPEGCLCLEDDALSDLLNQHTHLLSF